MANTRSTLRRRSSDGVRTLLGFAALCWASGEATAGVSSPCCTLTPPVITKNASGPGGKSSASDAPTPSAFAIATAGSGQASASNSSVTFVYEFVVSGTSSGTMVPLTIGAFAV